MREAVKPRWWPTLVVTVMTVVALAACGANDAGSASPSIQAGVEEQHGDQSRPPERLEGEELDRAFIKGMVPHHAAAVEMARAELDKGRRAEVKSLAQAIIDAQEHEIAQMSDIAREKYGFTPKRQHHGSVGALMGVPISMDMATMADKVTEAADPDTVFLEMMRPHHAGAIVMADEEMRNGGDRELKDIARKIVADQAKELGDIQQMLKPNA